MNKDKNNHLMIMRHSCSHVMAAAVLKLYPKVKFGIGPAIEDGFYYDFDFPEPITENDLEKISTSMIHFIEAKLPFEKQEVSINEAKKIFKNQPYKLELIEELAARGAKKVSTYQVGDFIDLCQGPHVENTSKIGPFKLLSLAGAYWRGSEKNKMLTRIYGTCFPSQKELDEYLEHLEEAKLKDHRKLGKELDLFSFHKEAPGFVFWHPKGMLIREALMNFYNELHKKAGYQMVSTPILLSEELWHQSGHWDNYKDKMYFTKIENKIFVIKPMNCPGLILIYKDRLHSYKEFPLRFAEAGEVHRHEPSGTLHGLLRVRAFRQDDAHIFAREDQVEKEIKEIIQLTLKLYKIIGFPEVDIELSTRPEKSIGTEVMWEKAEKTLKKILDDLNLEFKINEGEGSFYGPKIDFHIKDSLARSWQCGTIQLDFSIPERFELEYIDKDGLPKRPVMIHRTVIGSIQRFMGVLIEHFGGAFPVWLSPIQAIIIPITERQNDYGKKLLDKLQLQNIRVELDNRGETTSAKIRDAELQKIPYILVVGDREIKDSTVNVRVRGEKVLGPMVVEKFVKLIKEDIDKKRQV